MLGFVSWCEVVLVFSLTAGKAVELVLEEMLIME